MPHVDIKINTQRVDFDKAVEMMPRVAHTVGRLFEMEADFVSVEVVMQGAGLNRKDVDIELDGSPSPVRAERAGALAAELRDLALATFDDVSDLEVSAWVRLFQEGVYEYGAKDST